MGQILHGSAATTHAIGIAARTGPKERRSSVLGKEEEALVVTFRRHTLLPLDDCLYALQPTIPHLTRSSLHRCFLRHEISRLPEVEGPKPKAAFKATAADGFHRFHFGGHWDPDGTAMAKAIRAAAGRPDLPVRRFPWRMVRLLAPVVPIFREIAEMDYLWRVPLRMRNDRLVAAIGDEPHTPLVEAVRTTLAGIGATSEENRCAA
jgi:hypothetical protein